MKLLTFSGLRLGATFSDWPERGAEIRAALRLQLENTMARATAEGCAAVISCGDLFASNAVPTEEITAVTEACRRHPSVSLVVLPGAHDPWGPYSAYRHLQVSSVENLVLLRPGVTGPCRTDSDLFFYGLGIDAGASEVPGLSTLTREPQDGVHIAAVYGDYGRLRPGPEEGLVMISPEITHHPFDLLVLADGGPAEQLGSANRPAFYVAPAGPFSGPASGGGRLWKIDLDSGGARLEQISVGELREQEIAVDVTGFADLASLAQAIRRKVADVALAHVVLTGTRAADRTFLEPTLHSLCASDLLALRITDRTQTAEPEAPQERDPAAAALWQQFRQAEPGARQGWLDALKLHAAGIQDPARWKEAPWVRS